MAVDSNPCCCVHACMVLPKARSVTANESWLMHAVLFAAADT